MNSSFLKYVKYMPYSLLALLVVVSTMFTGCKTAVEADIEQTSFTSQKSIFSEAQMISRKQSCKAGVEYLAKLTLANSSEAASYISPMLSPVGFELAPNNNIPISKYTISRGSLNKNYSAAIDMFREYAINLAVSGDKLKTPNSVWPSSDVNYKMCSKLEDFELCRSYASERGFMLSAVQARKIWEAIENHSAFKCRKRASFRKY